MKVNGKHYTTIWLDSDGWSVNVIDQTKLPHEFSIVRLKSMRDAANAIRDMVVRGAPLIGVTAAYGIAMAMLSDTTDEGLDFAVKVLMSTRPTAVNLRWALERMHERLKNTPTRDRWQVAYQTAKQLADEDIQINSSIATHGLSLIQNVANNKPGKTVNILTHCNAGWLGTVDWGTALAPIYKAHDSGIPVHVWVDETRPRNQGASLTAWELGSHGVPHTIIVDNAGGHYMQHGMVDMCIVGTDRTTSTGDVCNKIGTYLKALAAHDNNVPFYVALPSPTIDWTLRDGVKEIPIEERSAREVTHMSGVDIDGKIQTFQVSANGSPAANPAFDVTPARLVTALITERGVCPATRDGMLSLFPERK